MSMTMTQKILAAHAGLQSVTAGQLIEAKLDLVLGNDVTSPVAINEMAKKGFKDVFSTDKIALVMDHFTPNKDIKSAENVKQVRLFAKEKGIKNFFDVGKMGIEHALLPESGLVISGRCRYRRRLTHLHIRRTRRVLYGCGLNRYGCRYDLRQGLV